MIDKKHITGIILAGGKSSRMGTDKGFLILNGKPFIEHIINALKPLVSELMIVSNHSDYDVFKLKRINDVIENSGPLAGIYSGLNASKTEYNLVLSCDIPNITSDILKQLIVQADTTSEVIQIESNNKTMPLIALYKTSCKTQFLSLLKSGERRLQYAVNQCQVKTIPLSADSAFYTINVNTPDDLKQINK